MNAVVKLVCKNIVYLRRRHGKTQKEVATFLGDTSRSNYAKLEAGISYITIDRLYSLAHLYQVSLDELTTMDLEEHFNENPALEDSLAPYGNAIQVKKPIGIQLEPKMLQDSTVKASFDQLVAALAAWEERHSK